MTRQGGSFQTIRRSIFTKPFFVLSAVSLIGIYFLVVRFTKGIGAVSNLSDGYPWGIWVAYDVALGTAIACGGYVVAVLTYILNAGRYHTLVRSAVLTTLFGSCLAAAAVVVDIGRPWNAYGFFVPTSWQPTSALFELTLCLAAYLLAQGIEYLPSVLLALQRWRPRLLLRVLRLLLPAGSLSSPLAEGSLEGVVPLLRPRLNRALILTVAAGIVLPTMHQSALGSLMLIASTKLHPLWHSPFLPMLFLINCLYIGFAIVILESLVCSFVLGRPYQGAALAELARLIPWLTCAWLVIRAGDLVHRDQMSAVFHGDLYSLFFLAEYFLMAVGTVSLLSAEKRRSPRWLFLTSAMMLVGGGLYRFNVYLIGFNPGSGWHYFPSFAEVMISAGIVSLMTLGYQVMMKVLTVPPARRVDN